MLVEPPLQTKKEREGAAQVLFERLDAPAIFQASSAVMTLYARGQTTGLVVESGEGISTVTPVLEGYAKRVRVVPWDLTGCDSSLALRRLYARKEEGLMPGSAATKIKQTLCFGASRLTSTLHSVRVGCHLLPSQ